MCEKLKNDQRTSHIPIILLTARAAVGDRIAGLRRGADAYLTKPFQREELLIVLNNLIRSRHLLQIRYGQLALGSTPDHAVPAGAGPEDQFVRKLRVVVEAQFWNADLSADAICQLMGMSRTTLHKKMTALTGLSVSRYLRALRLRKAQELLTGSSLNIAEVAYAVGFEDRDISAGYSPKDSAFRLDIFAIPPRVEQQSTFSAQFSTSRADQCPYLSPNTG